MLTGKQRAYLRSLAQKEECVLYVGKAGVTEPVIASCAAALEARELVKGKVLESSLLSAREACEALSEACRAEQVQFIGNKFVLYKRNEKEPKIELLKDKKKKA